MLRWGALAAPRLFGVGSGGVDQSPLAGRANRYFGRRGYFRPGGDGPAHDTTVSVCGNPLSACIQGARLAHL